MVLPLDDERCLVASLTTGTDEPRCDACGAELPPEDDDDGFGIPGTGVYVWTRGTEARFEEVPLCVACASAIGVTALARWESEEEEG